MTRALAASVGGRTSMTHSGNSPPLGPSNQGRGLAFRGREPEPETGPQDPEQSCPPHRQAPPSPAPIPSRSLRQAARPFPAWSGQRGTPGGLGPGHASEAANKGGLCAAGRRQDESPRPSRPRSPRRSPADSCGRGVLAAPQWRRRRRQAGRRGTASAPSPSPPTRGEKLRAEEPSLRPPGDKSATESTDGSDRSTSWLFTQQALGLTQRRFTWLLCPLEGRKVHQGRQRLRGGGCPRARPSIPEACFPKTLWSWGGGRGGPAGMNTESCPL